MVFQSFNLFPHLSILQNLTLAPIWIRKMSQRDAEKIAWKYLKRVNIAEHAHKFPSQLSGGQQQRAAIARSLCMLVVTHEMGFARDVCDRVVFMDQGQIIEDADPEKLFSNPDHPRIKAFLRKILQDEAAQ